MLYRQSKFRKRTRTIACTARFARRLSARSKCIRMLQLESARFSSVFCLVLPLFLSLSLCFFKLNRANIGLEGSYETHPHADDHNIFQEQHAIDCHFADAEMKNNKTMHFPQAGLVLLSESRSGMSTPAIWHRKCAAFSR